MVDPTSSDWIAYIKAEITRTRGGTIARSAAKKLVSAPFDKKLWADFDNGITAAFDGTNCGFNAPGSEWDNRCTEQWKRVRQVKRRKAK